uniref:PKD_channel domain-containing protein n=1 Tax=Macrostomum lignano TaxID=282301 RepID=A0A1I8FNZ8_9PLAT
KTTQQSVSNKSKQIVLPFWCNIVAWFLVLASVLVSGLFLVFYAMDWGRDKSQEWLAAFFLSTFQSVLIIQPLKVLAIGLVISVIMRKDYDAMKMDLVRRSSNTCMNSRKKKRTNELLKKARKTKVDLILSLILLVLLYCICYGNLDPVTYNLHKSIKIHLGVDKLSMVSTFDKYYEYLRTTLITALYSSDLPQLVNNLSQSQESSFISDLAGYRLSRVTVRQLRIRPVDVHRLAPPGGVHFSEEVRDTGCYRPGWRELRVCNYSETQSALELAFVDLPAKLTDSIDYWGRLKSYSGGGFTAVLPNGANRTMELLTELQRFNWLDNYTRLAIVEMDLFYPV